MEETTITKKQKKQEALSVSRLINEVLVAQLSIPFRQIVNDTTFSKYTGSKRPDVLISEFEYDGTNDEQYIKNLVAYAEFFTAPFFVIRKYYGLGQCVTDESFGYVTAAN